MSKSKIIGWVVASPFILIALGIAFCEANKAYWDHKVKQWCEKDGGVTVYEHIELTQEEYERNEGRKGAIRVAPSRTSKSEHEYAYRSVREVINKNNPSVWRSEYITFRKSDNEELGKWVTYSRGGGDFPTGFHPSSFGCSDIPGFEEDITRAIFSVKGEVDQ